MSSVAAIFREEIRRVIRKEIRAQSGTTKRAVTTYRSDIAQLRRVLTEQARKLKYLTQRLQRQERMPREEDPLEAIRFRPAR